MTSIYYLMHRNDPVATLNFNENGDLVKVGQSDSELSPLGTRNSGTNLIKWWKNRAVPETRNGISAALNVLGIKNTGDFLVRNLGLSLSDHYWVKPYGDDLSWDEVNLYTNDFSDFIGDFQFTGNREELLSLTGRTEFVPSASLQGELKKKWIIDEKKNRLLIKGNYLESCRQSLNEVFASQIHKIQHKMPYTTYELIQIDTSEGKTIGCICPNFTNENLEFVSAYDVCMSKKHSSDISEFQNFIDVCEEHGLEKEYVREFLEYQIMTDFIITNTDRHFNNLGILRDTETLKFVDVAPIFDSGNSMFYNRNITKATNLLDIPVASFQKKEISLLKHVSNPRVLDLSKLPSRDEAANLYGKDSEAGNLNLDEVICAYEKKIILADAMQHGADLKEAAYRSRKDPFEKIMEGFFGR